MSFEAKQVFHHSLTCTAVLTRAEFEAWRATTNDLIDQNCITFCNKAAPSIFNLKTAYQHAY